MTASEGWGRYRPGDDAVDFDAAWPSVRARMAAVLRKRGVQATDVDDIAQEVAFRALRDRHRFDSVEHLTRWCCRVAINLHIDAARRQHRLSYDPPPDVAGNRDTARTVEQRLALERVTAAIADLSPEERQLLLDSQPAASRRDAVRLAVRRHRLRARLVTLLEGVVACFAVVRRALRSLSPPAKAGVAALPVVAGLLIAPLSVGPHSDPARHPPPSAGSAPSAVSPSERLLSADHTNGSPAAAHPRRSTAAQGTRTSPTASAGPARTLVALGAAGPVKVSEDQRPADDPIICLFGHLQTCVPRPIPPVAEPHPPQVTRS